MSEPEQEPQHEPQSEPSEADVDVRHQSTTESRSTNVSEAEDEGFNEAQKASSISSISSISNASSSFSKTKSWSFSSEKSDVRVERNDRESEHMMLLYASPLCFRDGRGMMPLPQIPVEKEWETVLGAYNEASHILSRTSSAAPGVSISAQTLTAGSLQRAKHKEFNIICFRLILASRNRNCYWYCCFFVFTLFPPSNSTLILLIWRLAKNRLRCYYNVASRCVTSKQPWCEGLLGAGRWWRNSSLFQFLACNMRNMFSFLFFVCSTWRLIHIDSIDSICHWGCSMLRAMLELAGSSTRLVLLNCCSLSTMGNEFVEAGVPHVVCCSCDLKDSASQIFLRVFYSNLFQGTSVQRAFNEAIVALRSHSERSAQAASHHFRLLPEGNPGLNTRTWSNLDKMSRNK